MREARVECECAIDQGEGGINVLAEAPEHNRGSAEHTRIIGGEADGPPGEIDGRLAIFLLRLVRPNRNFQDRRGR